MKPYTAIDQEPAADVTNPAHYRSHPSGVECIEITRHMDFNLGNAIKYIWRAGLKSPDRVTDLRKALWYVEDAIKNTQPLRRPYFYDQVRERLGYNSGMSMAFWHILLACTGEGHSLNGHLSDAQMALRAEISAITQTEREV